MRFPKQDSDRRGLSATSFRGNAFRSGFLGSGFFAAAFFAVTLFRCRVLYSHCPHCGIYRRLSNRLLRRHLLRSSSSFLGRGGLFRSRAKLTFGVADRFGSLINKK